MIEDAMTNPPLPEWNALTNDERGKLVDEWRYTTCACSHSWSSPCGFYDELRKVLKERELRYLKAMMAFDPETMK